jgi:hypothetical protein
LEASPAIVLVRTTPEVAVLILTKTRSGWKPTPVIARLSAPLPVKEPVATRIGVEVLVGVGV